MSRTYAQPVPPQGPGSDHARMMCMDSAASIAKLLQIYEVRYALRRMAVHAVGIVCSAALLLVFQNVTRYNCGTDDEVKMNLSACLRALEQFELSWESAKRAREFLLLLQQQWELRSRDARKWQESATYSQPRKRAQPSGETNPPESHRIGIAPPAMSSGRPGDNEPGYMENELDIDWTSADFPFTIPPDILDRL